MSALLPGLWPGTLGRVDEQCYHWWLVHRAPLADASMIALSYASQPAVMAAASLGVAWVAKSRYRIASAWQVPASVVGAALLSPALKAAVGRSRPPLETQLLTELNGSFPSGHVNAVTALAVSMVLLPGLTPRVRTVAATLGAAAISLIACNRMYLGVHWFTDTLAGAALGGGVAVAVSLAASVGKTLRQRVQRRDEQN